MTNDESRKRILERFSEFGEFEPSARYDPDGDCLEFFFTGEEFKGKRLDRWVTVYYGRDTSEIVGACIKDWRKLLVEFPGLDIDIHDNKVLVSLALRAPAWRANDAVVQRTYKVVIQKAEDANLEAELAMSGV